MVLVLAADNTVFAVLFCSIFSNSKVNHTGSAKTKTFWRPGGDQLQHTGK